MIALNTNTLTAFVLDTLKENFMSAEFGNCVQLQPVMSMLSKLRASSMAVISKSNHVPAVSRHVKKLLYVPSIYMLTIQRRLGF